MITSGIVHEKINEIIFELRHQQLSKKQMPAWVSQYEKNNNIEEYDFSEWLQFVYLPNLLQHAGSKELTIQKSNVVLQAIKFFGEDVKKGRLLRLLIELDSLS